MVNESQVLSRHTPYADILSRMGEPYPVQVGVLRSFLEKENAQKHNTGVKDAS